MLLLFLAGASNPATGGLWYWLTRMRRRLDEDDE